MVARRILPRRIPSVEGVRASANLITKRRSALSALQPWRASRNFDASAASRGSTIASSFGAEMKRRLPRLLSFRSSKRRPLLDLKPGDEDPAPLVRFRSMRLPLAPVSNNEAYLDEAKPDPRIIDTSPAKSSASSSPHHLVDVALVHGHRSASALCSSASSGEVASTACSRSHSVSSPIESPSNERASTIANFVLAELLTTEQTYVRELQSLVEYYVNPFEAPENQHLISPAIRGRSDLVFGNLRELYEFHNKFLLSEILKSSDCAPDICHCLVSQRNRFLNLYLPYCQNKSVSEVLRREHVDGTKFFLECQKRAGHPLPLSAYLLKPIQRITKYQLLLKELAAHCSDDIRRDVQISLDSMLQLLSTLNGAMNQLHISGYAGDLSLLGPLRLQTECDVYAFKKKTHRLNKAQRRYLFLFDGGILFCKKRTQPVPYAPEYYEHKMCIPMRNLGFAECAKSCPDRFEIWDVNKTDGYAVFAFDERARQKWIQKLSKMTARLPMRNLGFAECAKSCPDRFEIWDVNKTDGYAVFAFDERARQKWIQKLSKMTARLPVPPGQSQPERNPRPHSWTSTISSDSNTSRSSIDDLGTASSSSMQTFTTSSLTSKTDANGNDRSDEKTASVDSNSENLADHLDNNSSAHVTNIQIPLSKSLQNCEITDSLEAPTVEALNQHSQLVAQ
uniref:DH domain-containing protein n=1 Tax=Steinernema glaseri TaxID=37863 RepID=A0A1I7Z9D9_9BILA